MDMFTLINQWRINLKKSVLLALCFVLVIGLMAHSAELAKEYVDVFGWGSIAASEKEYPPKSEFKKELFDFRDGKCFVSANEARENLNIRAMMKDGKNIGEFLAKVKQQYAQELKTRTRDVTKTIFWASHNKDGEAIAKTWPTSLASLPDWQSLEEKSLLCEEDVEGWNSLGWKRENAEVEMNLWLKAVKPGWKLYVAFFTGFEREMPEARYWDEAVGGYKNPSEDVISEPIAAGTIEFK